MIDADINSFEGTRSDKRHSADMARFYFDTYDGTVSDTDDEGVEFPDLQAARGAAQTILAVMIGEKVPIADRVGLRVVVRDESGMQVYCANLMLDGDTATLS